MLLSFYTSKPLYHLQRNIDYRKHKQKLKQIQSKSFKTHQNTSMQIRPWVKQNMKIQVEKQNKVIEEENQKLLSKLIKISTRNNSQFTEKYKVGENLFRKNWLKNIKKENQQLSQKLTNLKCSLEYKKFSKSIDHYQRVKKSMMINRKIKLPQFNKSLMWKKFFKNTSYDIKNVNLSQDKCQKIPQLHKLKFSSKDLSATSFKIERKKSKTSFKSSLSRDSQQELS